MDQPNRVPAPDSMAGRPTDHRGFPVPWFVTEKTPEGHWDFVRISGQRFDEARRKDVCWVSGQPLGRYRSFVIGPMCVINRVAADPPVRLDIARWSAQVCPFLSRPLAKRDTKYTDEELARQRGVMLTRNPGVCAIYTVERGSYDVDGGLFYLGDPVSVEWCARGRAATREEVDASIATGLPALDDMARKQGGAAQDELRRRIASAAKFLPIAA